MLPFIDGGKAVFAAEYRDAGVSLNQICPEADRLGFSVILRNRDLDAERGAFP